MTTHFLQRHFPYAKTPYERFSLALAHWDISICRHAVDHLPPGIIDDTIISICLKSEHGYIKEAIIRYMNMLEQCIQPTQEHFNIGVTDSDSIVVGYFLGLPQFTLSSLQLESGLTHTFNPIRELFSYEAAKYALSSSQIERGLLDQHFIVRHIFLSNKTLTLSPNQIDRGIFDINPYASSGVLQRTDFTIKAEHITHILFSDAQIPEHHSMSRARTSALIRREDFTPTHEQEQQISHTSFDDILKTVRSRASIWQIERERLKLNSIYSAQPSPHQSLAL
jgi:hypothetical protein